VGRGPKSWLAYVREAYLISNHHNGQRLAALALTRTVLGPTILCIATSLYESENATFKKATAEAADESKPEEVRAAAQGRTMRSRAQLEALELLRTQPLQHFTLPIHPLHNWHVSDALDAEA
jgi:hypothetical protein